MSGGPVVGLAGCGRWGVNIVRDLIALGCDVAVADQSVDAREQAAAMGVGRTVPSADELPDVDGIVIATPSMSHAAVLDAVLARGVPVFVEKPIVPDVDALARLAGGPAADRVFEMHKWRFHPGIEALAAIARSEELGAVHSVATTRLGELSAHYDLDPVWILAPHDLSIVLEILGTVPAPVAARAVVHDGRAVALSGLSGDHPWCSVAVSGVSSQWRREVVLTCERGSAALLAPDAGRLIITRDGSSAEERRAVSAEAPLLRELRAFVGFLGGGPPPRSSLADSLAVATALVEWRDLAGLAPT